MPDSQFPLLSMVEERYSELDMRDVLLVSCQHLLGSQLRMYEGLMRLGLQPKNCVVIGKCYSANERVISDLAQLGAIVAPFSSEFCPDVSFDAWFGERLARFLPGLFAKLRPESFRKVVILDDGGHLHAAASVILDGLPNVAGVEQTTSGERRVRSRLMPYPVTSIARWWTKQALESPHIAKLACDRIVSHASYRRQSAPSFLVIGLGAIGRCAAGYLEQMYPGRVWVTDRQLDGSLPTDLGMHALIQMFEARGRLLSSTEAQGHLNDFSVLVGATGEQVLSDECIDLMHPKVSLISLSSSDREFPSLAFRRGIHGGVHDDYYLGERCLVNGGFPITFYGNYNEVAPCAIELTVASLSLSVMQASATPELGQQLPSIRAQLQDTWLSSSLIPMNA